MNKLTFYIQMTVQKTLQAPPTRKHTIFLLKMHLKDFLRSQSWKKPPLLSQNRNSEQKTTLVYRTLAGGGGGGSEVHATSGDTDDLQLSVNKVQELSDLQITSKSLNGTTTCLTIPRKVRLRFLRDHGPKKRPASIKIKPTATHKKSNQSYDQNHRCTRSPGERGVRRSLAKRYLVILLDS